MTAGLVEGWHVLRAIRTCVASRQGEQERDMGRGVMDDGYGGLRWDLGKDG